MPILPRKRGKKERANVRFATNNPFVIRSNQGELIIGLIT
jgi:hypothetical protein